MLVNQAVVALWRPIIAPTLIGRDGPMQTIAALCDAVQAGEAAPQTLLVSGEAGIGKSRLAAAARERLGRQGWHVLSAAAAEADQSQPLGVLVTLLHRICSHFPPETIAATLGPAAPIVARLLPELSPFFAAETAAEMAELPHLQRLFFAGLGALCTRMADAAPLLIAVDDAHWSDPTSLVGLYELMRRLRGKPIVFFLTARPAAPTHALAGLITQLQRERALHELPLAPLNREELDLLVQITLRLRHPTPAAFLHGLAILTDGNPFFVEEVLSALVVSGQLSVHHGAVTAPDTLPIPASLRAAVQRHAAFLSPEASELLRTAAVIGRRFDFHTLQHLLERPEAALLSSLKEVIAAGLLVEAEPDRFAFRHALAQAVFAEELLTRERRGMHRRLGELLTAAGAVGQAGAASEHFFAALEWAPALHWARLAADEALRLYAPHEAIIHLSRALAAAQHLAEAPTAELRHLRGQAYETIGETATAQADYAAALASAQATDRPADAWQALFDLGNLWLTRDAQRAATYLEAMHAVARTLDDPLRLGRSLNSLGALALSRDDPLTAQQHHREALARFTAADDRRGMTETLAALGSAAYLGGNLAQGTAAFTEAIAGFRALNDQGGVIHCLSNLGLRAAQDTERLDATTLSELEPALAHALAMTERFGRRTDEACVRTLFGRYLIAVGRYDGAAAMLQAALQIARESEHPWWTIQARAALGLLYSDLLAPRRALAQLTPALAEAQAGELTMLVRDVCRYLVGAHVQVRAFAPAEAALLTAAAPRNAGEARSVIGRQLLCAAAEVALARGDAQAALELIDGLIATAAEPGGVIPNLWRLRGMALMHLRRYAEARTVLEAALTTARAEGRRPLAWRIAAALANLAQRQHRERDAQQAAAAALALISELAQTIPERALRETFSARAAAAVPTVVGQSHRQTVKQTFDGLTDRERAVARLVANGRSNREVAAELVISERTVTTHLSNILGKLNLTSRTQLARWALDKGLE